MAKHKMITYSGAEYTVDIKTGQVTGGSENLKEKDGAYLEMYPALGKSMAGLRYGARGLGMWNSSPIIRVLDEDGDTVVELDEDEYAEVQEAMEKDLPDVDLEKDLPDVDLEKIVH